MRRRQVAIELLEGNQIAGGFTAAGQHVAYTRHVIDRYRERVKPALDLRKAREDLALLAQRCGQFTEIPEWLDLHEDRLTGWATRWLMIGDDIAIPLQEDRTMPGGQCWLAVSCLTRGGRSDLSKAKRSAARRRHFKQTAKTGRQREGRARARAKAMTEEQETRWAA
jgi:hypothetical protein